MFLIVPGWCYSYAPRYAPAVLLLRRFGALTKSLAGGGQDQQKTISLIGAALRDGIHAHLEDDQEEDLDSRYDYENGSAISDVLSNASSKSEDQLTLAQGFKVFNRFTCNLSLVADELCAQFFFLNVNLEVL